MQVTTVYNPRRDEFVVTDLSLRPIETYPTFKTLLGARAGIERQGDKHTDPQIDNEH